MKRTSAFIEYAKDALGEDSLVLIDVGCSGGLPLSWRTFGEKLCGFAFDPNVHDIDRLKSEEKNRNIEYISAFVGLPENHPFALLKRGRGHWGRNPSERLSAFSALKRVEKKLNGRAESGGTIPCDELTRHNLWNRVPLADSERVLHLPTFLESRAIGSIDFVKIDVDGADFEILVSLEDSLAKLQCLGLQVEVNYFGSEAETDHTFHNIDRFLKKLGFELFDLEVRRYSCVALPAPFVSSEPGSTTFGRPLQGDAVYFRDLGDPRYDSFANTLSNGKLIKLACMFDLFGLPDCAAEILLKFRSRLDPVLDVGHALDLLIPHGLTGPAATRDYEEYMRLFEADHPSFYKAQWPWLLEQTLGRLLPSYGWLLAKPLLRLASFVEGIYRRKMKAPRIT